MSYSGGHGESTAASLDCGCFIEVTVGVLMGKCEVTWAQNGLRTPEMSNSDLMAPYG